MDGSCIWQLIVCVHRVRRKDVKAGLISIAAGGVVGIAIIPIRALCDLGIVPLDANSVVVGIGIGMCFMSCIACAIQVFND